MQLRSMGTEMRLSSFWAARRGDGKVGCGGAIDGKEPWMRSVGEEGGVSDRVIGTRRCLGARRQMSSIVRGQRRLARADRHPRIARPHDSPTLSIAGPLLRRLRQCTAGALHASDTPQQPRPVDASVPEATTKNADAHAMGTTQKRGGYDANAKLTDVIPRVHTSLL